MKTLVNKYNGFTIIELLITISTIGFIAFTISHFLSVQERSHNRITRTSNNLLQGQKVINRIAEELKFGRNYNIPNPQSITYEDNSNGVTTNCSIYFIGGNIFLTRGMTTQTISTRHSIIDDLQFILVPDNTVDNNKQNRTIRIVLTLNNGATYQTTVFGRN